ncbi:MAG TPA: aminopeptidase [Eubacteriales bacterium]|nr:aminopeptidase [Eubacteriales bacterium]
MNAKLNEYARLLVEVGINIQKGQRLVITCPTEWAEFGRACAKIAYENGCKEVVMRWTDEQTSRLRLLYGEDSIFDEVPEYIVRFFTDYAKEGAARLVLNSGDPMAFAGVDMDRLSRSQKSEMLALREYRELAFKNIAQWSIGCLVSPAWAKTVYPDLDEAEAIDRLWDDIFMAVRVKGDNKAVEAWQQHIDNLKLRCDWLNSLHLKYLHYKSGIGTDFTLRLAEDNVWCGGGDTTTGGVYFMPNMPTEEIFSAPHTHGSSGVIVASMPLCYGGSMIENIRMTVEDGRIVSATATAGEQLLNELLNTDEGASRFGEVALVPFDSPISNTGTLFYKTLFDENAYCHFAFGKAYPDTVAGGGGMSNEELKAHGVNNSAVHVDFMVGTADLEITGFDAEGRGTPIFRNGGFTK